MNHPSRRGLFGLVATSALVPIGDVTANGLSPHPDADLIRICEGHAAKIDAFNKTDLDLDDCPSGQAYEESMRAISAAQPRTLDGMIAKARAAKAEARNPDGSEGNPDHTMAATWAWDLVNDLLAGRAGA